MGREIAITAAAALLSLVSAQQIGTTAETHPQLITYKCTTAGGCVAQSTSVVLEWGYHWIHQNGTSTSCTTSSGTDPTLCGTEAACGQNCVIEGANYATSGVATSGSSLTLHQYVTSGGTTTSQSPRVYLLDPSGQNYDMLKLLGQEISFDVDASTLVCGENGAFYLSEMDPTGGRSSNNPGGAAFGSGYCDAQCPVSTWFNGSVNTGSVGACCNEMDLWEANGRATALTPHPCSVTSIGGCTGADCGSSGFCDKNGCGFNPYALGQQGYYGPGLTVDTSKPVTVTTQFITNDGTTTGTLTEIRRQYIQNGVIIANAVAAASSGFPGQTKIDEPFCEATDSNAARLGGLSTMGKALGRGMVLVMSIWNDAGGYMNWLDSGTSGPCSSTEGNPTLIQAQNPGTYVTFSNIKIGDIGSTFKSTSGGSGSSSSVVSSASMTKATSTSSRMSTVTMKTSTTTVKTSTSTTIKPVTSTSSAAGPTQSHYGQCGGTGWTGPKVCASPYKCTASNQYYSQCL